MPARATPTTYRSLSLGAGGYEERLKKGGWTLYGSFRASKVIAAGRTQAPSQEPPVHCARASLLPIFSLPSKRVL